MKKFFFLLFTSVTFFVFAQQPSKDYLVLWEKVYEDELNLLPKSALEKVNKIHQQAKKENNEPQQIRCLIYKSKFALKLEENAQLKVVESFKTTIENTKNLASKALLRNMLAYIYWEYYQQNRWKIHNRTKTEEVQNNDFRTWDLDRLLGEIHQLYQQSLQKDEFLKSTAVADYAELMKAEKVETDITLYEFLASKALTFYKDDRSGLTKPQEPFVIDNKKYLTEIETVALKSTDSTSNKFQALKIYQSLIQFQKSKKELSDYFNTLFSAADYVLNKGVFDNENELKLSFLQGYTKIHTLSKSSVLLYFEIAKTLYKEKEYKESVKICKTLIEKFPNKAIIVEAKKLKSTIEKQNLRVQIQEYVPVSVKSMVLVEYRNLQQASFKLMKVNDEITKRLNEFTYNEKQQKKSFLDSLSKVKEWTVNLKNTGDYLNHQTEIVLPELVSGHYLLLGETKEGTYAYKEFQATNLVFLKKKNGVFQVVNRNNGSPVANAKVHLKTTNNRWYKRLNKTKTTDSNGEFTFFSKAYYSGVIATITHQQDNANFIVSVDKKPNKHTELNEDEVLITPFVFTDRSIYRPGQTVYFKAILVKKQGTKTLPFTQEHVQLTVENTNGEEVQVFDLQLSEYGTVSGEFKIPQSGLLGEYSFYFEESDKHLSKFYDDALFDFDYAHHVISVEEYKRPKFETAFNPVKEIYKVNDTVKVTGTATALSGSTITNAKVSYRVVRKARYPRWCWWVPMPSSSQEIAHGTTKTLADGTYSIPFKALPDETVSAKNLPTFYYTVYADVTDVNGETRSAETEVKVGYHAMDVSVTVANQLDVSVKNHEIHIATQNLNGQLVNSKGVVSVYKLKAPEFPQVDRPWNRPDFPVISDRDYQEWFPNYTFNHVSDPKKWEKEALVYQKNFNTAKEKKVLLKNIKKWKTGNYQIIVTAKDPWGQEVKDEVIVSVFDNKAKKVADNSMFHIALDKNSYAPNDEVVVSVGTASKDMTVFLEVEKENQELITYKIHLNDEIKQLKIPVSLKDTGGFFVNWYWVNKNSFKTGETFVSVPKKATNLQIETVTFRDVLEPGSNQKWSFKITGADKEKATAEVLASMYDVSLDHFLPHNWSFTPINHTKYRSGYGVSATTSFNTSSFFVISNNSRYYNYRSSIKVPDFNWFGFSFRNSFWIQNNYLKEISYVASSHKKVKDVSIANGIIKLTLLDAETNEVIPGVNVVSKGNKKQGVVSDFDGIAKLSTKKEDILEISCLGYKTHSIKIEKNFNHYIVRLSPDSAELDEVVVVGYGTKKKAFATASVSRGYVNALQGRVAGVSISDVEDLSGSENVQIRGLSSVSQDSKPLVIIDGKIVVVDDLDSIDKENIASMELLKNEEAIAIYGAKGVNGVVLITTKAEAKKLEQALGTVKARTNFNETAFFFPTLRTNKKGEVSFEFTMPEDLTRWKLQLLAHDKQLNFANKTLTAVTQKQLMVIPNPPRFLREGDEITLSTKIANLTKEATQGKVKLELTDAVTGKNIDGLLQNTNASQTFWVDKKGNTLASWSLQIPENITAIQYKIVATTNGFSDGEQNVLPVLSNRMLVTETLPLWVNGGQSQTFTLKGLKNNTSSTLKNHQLSLEITSNPAWYAVQALPYLMEYPYECAEQTFARYYANQLASHVVNSSPKIKEVFQQWADSNALVSSLEKNKELKSIIIQETPWLRDAQSETEQKKRIAMLFNLSKMDEGLESAIKKLEDMQLHNGGFPWFKGSKYANRSITQHIVQGYHHLKKIGVSVKNKKIANIILKAQKFLDKELLEDYENLLEHAQKIKDKAKSKKEGIEKEQEYLSNYRTNSFQLQYLYVLSFNLDRKKDKELEQAILYYYNQAKEFWKEESLYNKGLLSLICYRNKEEKLTKSITKSIKENSVFNKEMGRYWKENKSGWSWYQDPIVTQSLLIELFSEINENTLFVDELKQWLLKNKQVQQWKTTKATSEAVYALLLQGTDWLSVEESVVVEIGRKPIPESKLENVKVEAGTGYYKTQWRASEITSDLATVTLTKKNKGVAWGALYWQYFENLDHIKQAESPLNLTKKMFLKKNTNNGPVLELISKDTDLQVGDVLTVRIELESDRNVEFIHMKDMRSAGLEPIDVISEYKWQDGLGYYQSTKDTATHFFFDGVGKGVYVFEYEVRVSHKGVFSNGITLIESMYAPEFSSHSKGIQLVVENE